MTEFPRLHFPDGAGVREQLARAAAFAAETRASVEPQLSRIAVILRSLADRFYATATAKAALRSSGNQSDIASALATCRSAFIGLAVFSGMSNVLMLTGSFFMLQVYDRVLPSRSVPTLIGIAVLAVMLYLLQGAIDLIRSRINVRIGRMIDATLSERIYQAIVRFPLKARGDGDGLQPMRDLDSVRSFLASGGPSALFDLPWMPLYLAICFLFHVWIGLTALAGAFVLIGLTLLAEVRTKEPTRTAASFAKSRQALATAGRRNAEVLRAMGMTRNVAAVWSDANRSYLGAHEAATDLAGGLGGASKVFRMILQSTVLAVGAYLVINQQATAGIIIASSILTARALAPVELAIANWKGFVAARQGVERLRQLLTLFPADAERLPLPAPRRAIEAEGVTVVPPGGKLPVVHGASLALQGGQALGIIGPSGSGKSSLVRTLVGVWGPAAGTVRIDGATLDQWPPETLGRHIGYLPQDVELFDGSIAQNIARFDSNPDSGAIIAAARAAGVHELILSFDAGYDTPIGEGGMTLSAGQRQRVALARALYGDPFLVVLDEPSSNLDAVGEQALTRAVEGVRARGGIVILIAHRPSALAGTTHVLVLANGRIQAFGPKDAILKGVAGPSMPAAPLRVVGAAQGAA